MTAKMAAYRSESRSLRRIPFAGPTTALAATIDSADEEWVSDAAKRRALELARAVLRLFNHLHEDSTTYENRQAKNSQDRTASYFFSAGRKSNAAEFMQ
jgi:hypothetical protein